MSTTPRRALLSVSNKTGLLPLAQALAHAGWEILSTGGTAQFLREGGLAIREVADITGFPEILDGRVKTLHPHIHGALLARRDEPSHQAQLREFGIGLIDVLVVNLYPFVDTVAKPEVSINEAIENIDVGGPAMIRAAAKNHEHLTVLVDPNDYPSLISAIAHGQWPDINARRTLAAKAFAHTSRYDHAVQDYLNRMLQPSAQSAPDEADDPRLPPAINVQWVKKQTMRYGENAHQSAALYVSPAHELPFGLPAAQILQGKAMSFNNYGDADAAWRCVVEFNRPACVIVKHANPCGVAVSDTALLAYQRAFACDPTSAFGGILAFNRAIDGALARAIGEQFAEVILAPDYTEEARTLFAKKANVRLLKLSLPPSLTINGLEIKSVLGGVLVQTADEVVCDRALQVVSEKTPTIDDLEELRFAFTVAKHVKSNAIVFTRDQQTLGIGAGQMSRIDSTRIAVMKAQERGFNLQGSVVASDAFFPFRDGVDALASAGARAVIHPGGSMRDAEVIASANEQGLIMVLTGIRHFRH